MNSNARLLCATSSVGPKIAYGHALSGAPRWVICDDRIRILAHPIFKMQGISVPIFTGGPPILSE